MPTIHLTIKGKVQGVFYRASAKDMARSLELTGWVKNTPEGDVEALVSGPQDKLDQLAEWCKVGPRRAQVSDVICTPATEQHFDSFTVIH